MSFHIVCDSCTDLTEEDLKKGCYTLVPLTLLVDGEEIIDDETFDQADFLAKVAASKESVKSACPAPESYMEAYSKADDNIICRIKWIIQQCSFRKESI